MSTRDSRLDLLLRELAEARDDDRYMHVQFVTLITAAIALIGILGAFFYKTCAEGYCSPSSALTPVPIWIYVAAPVLPQALIAYGVLLSALQLLRSYYMRRIERAIHQLTGRQPSPDFPLPSWAHVHLEVTSRAHGRGWASFNWAVVFGTLYLAAIGCLFVAVTRIPVVRYRVLSVILDGGLLLIPLLSVAVYASVGAGLWTHALDGLQKRLERTDLGFPPEHPPQERKLLSYLLLPRNQEELLKALFIPVCFVIARVLAPGLPHRGSQMMLDFVGFFLIFEFLIYQARYLWNDLRDREEDNRPDISRRRFPSSWLEGEFKTRALHGAVASFVLRWGLAVLVVGCILPYDHLKWALHLAFLAAIFAIAFLYEAARTRCRRALREGGNATAWALGLNGIVGLGYGLRGLVGFWLAGVGDKWSLALVTIAASLLGATFIGLTWALESSRAPAQSFASGKAHLAVFRDKFVSGSAARSGVPLDCAHKVLKGAQSPLAPWAFAAVAAVVTLLVSVSYFVRGQISPRPMILVGTLTFVFAAISTLAPAWVSRLLAPLVLVALAFALHRLGLQPAPSVLAAAVTALPLFLTSWYRSRCYKDIVDPSDKIAAALGACFRHFHKWLLSPRPK